MCCALVNTSPVTTGCRKPEANMCSSSAPLCSFFSHSFSSATSASRLRLLVRVSSPAAGREINLKKSRPRIRATGYAAVLFSPGPGVNPHRKRFRIVSNTQSKSQTLQTHPLQLLSVDTISLQSSKWAIRPLCACVSITLPAATLASRSSRYDGIEPTKHFLKKYLARARLAVLASTFTCGKEHIFFGTL
jgi:hypothetical protein